jgi:hypothetical protein
VRIGLGTLDLEKALGPGAAAFVDHDHRLLHELMLLDDRIDEARHLIGATARARRNDELHGLGGFPSLGREIGRRERCERERRYGERHRATMTIHSLTLLALRLVLLDHQHRNFR